MSDEEKYRTIRLVGVLDNMRRQLFLHVYKITALIAASELPGCETIMHDIDNAVEHVNGILTMSRYRILNSFYMQHPDTVLLEVESECSSLLD